MEGLVWLEYLWAGTKCWSRSVLRDCILLAYVTVKLSPRDRKIFSQITQTGLRLKHFFLCLALSPSKVAHHPLFSGFLWPLCNWSPCFHILYPSTCFSTVARVVLNYNSHHCSLLQQCFNAQRKQCKRVWSGPFLSPITYPITFSPQLTMLQPCLLFSTSNICRSFLPQALCTCFRLCLECSSFSPLHVWILFTLYLSLSVTAF